MIKAGDRVRVRKGTQIFTTHPKKRTVTAGTYTVKVHHMLPPYEALLAERIHYKDGPQVHLRLDDIEQRQLLQRLGMPTQTSQEVQTGIEQLLATARVAVPYSHGNVECFYVRWAPEKVVWVGTGGYWCEAAAADVEKVT